MDANSERFEKVTLSREVLQSFGKFRSRGTRSVSSESTRSKISEPGSENHEEVAMEDGFPSIQHPSPVYESDSDDVTYDTQFKDHAQKLNVHLEVASTFGKVSTLCVDSHQSAEDQKPRSITSFHAKHAINLHIAPKIRRASSPCVTFAPQFFSAFNSPETRFSLGLKAPETLLKEDLLPITKTIRARGEELPPATSTHRKRSWDHRCFNQ